MASAGPVPTPLGASDLAIPPEKGRGKNTILLAIAGTAIGLSLLAGLVVFFAGGSSGDTPATATTDNGVAVAPPTSAPTDVAAPPTSQPSEPSQPAEPVASAAPTTTPTEPAPPAQPTPVAGGSQPSTPQGGSTPSRPITSPLGPPTVTAKPTSAPTSAPAGGGEAMGTLVAVAVGGSCAFSVNGASKGSGATIKVPLKPGTYSVSCKPVSGATKSRSVTVTSGGTAMAMFKL